MSLGAGVVLGEVDQARALFEGEAALVDAFALQVVTAIGGIPDPASYAAVLDGLPGADPALVRSVVDRLVLLALAWGDDDELHLVRPVREALGTYPAGLGPAMTVLLFAGRSGSSMATELATSATATSLTFVPVAPVRMSPPTACKAW